MSDRNKYQRTLDRLDRERAEREAREVERLTPERVEALIDAHGSAWMALGEGFGGDAAALEAEAHLTDAVRALLAELERKDAALREAMALVERVNVGNVVGPHHRRAIVPKDWLDRARALVPVADQTGETATGGAKQMHPGHPLIRRATTEDQTGGESDG